MTVAKHAEHAECQNMLLDPRMCNEVYFAKQTKLLPPPPEGQTKCFCSQNTRQNQYQRRASQLIKKACRIKMWRCKTPLESRVQNKQTITLRMQLGSRQLNARVPSSQLSQRFDQHGQVCGIRVHSGGEGNCSRYRGRGLQHSTFWVHDHLPFADRSVPSRNPDPEYDCALTHTHLLQACHRSQLPWCPEILWTQGLAEGIPNGMGQAIEKENKRFYFWWRW